MLINSLVKCIIDPLLPTKQTEFWCERSTVDQAVLLTQNIKDCLEVKKKAGAMFVDLKAALDTVWHCDLTCKLFKLLPDKHMIQMILGLVQNSSFTLTIGSGKQSKLQCLKNGIPQG